jgi:hypothetical protein
VLAKFKSGKREILLVLVLLLVIEFSKQIEDEEENETEGRTLLRAQSCFGQHAREEALTTFS